MAAEVVVSVVSEALINKLISIASQDIGRVFLGVKGEFTKLHRTLSSIQAVLSDAEKKQIEDKAVKDWLTKLNEVAYDIEDIVDEFEYEALRRKLEIRGRVLNKVRNFFSLSNPLAFRFKMASKIKNINEMLDEITRDKERFQFSPSNIVNCFANKEEKEERETSSHVDDSKIVGRELDKSKVTDILVNNTRKVDNFSVVRIVGMGGVGKTTLAQLVFNDKLVKDHFDTRMWVCVSDNSTEKTVYSNLLESINGKKSDVSRLDVMLSSLKESLGRKKYLIVLDDVWNDGKIDRGNMFSILLSMGVEGSRIIVTTRTDEDIPSMMGSIYTHRLVGLSEIECWSIFEKIAFGNGGAKKSAELINIGKEIVKKCGGVPLAAKTLGGMMYSTSDENEWLSIQKSEIWSLPEGEKKILCVLKLSYDRFSPQLKRCFSYCSIFPKDHKIKKMKLIQLWMAEGFLTPSSENEALGNIGKKYINILLQNSFIEGGHRTFIGKKAYKMHDLVHDLALSVSGMEYSLSDSWTIEGKETERLRHVRLVHKEQVSTIPKAIYRAKKLRTFVYITREFVKVPKNVWDHMFLNFNYLRVMDLRRADIEELPPSIGKLKHLRFIHMPREVGKLSLLERLCVFVVGKDNGYGIEELKDLHLLGGKLEIHSLENVRNGGDAKKANLKEKPNVRNLDLNWMYEFGNPDRVGDHYAVLEGLQPHRNLKELSIRYYFATKFPTWIASHLLV